MTFAPTAIVELGRWTDGTRRRQFSIDGVTVQVTAPTSADDAAAAELIQQLHLVCSIPPVPPGETPWRYVRLGPGVRAAVCETSRGDVRLQAPPGDLKITEGAVELAVTILDAHLKVQLRERQRRAVTRAFRQPRRAAPRGAR